MARSIVLVRGLAAAVFAGLLIAVAAQPAPAAVPRDDTATVCRNVGTTINNELQALVTQLRRVSDLASSGDQAGAEANLKQAAASLQATSAQLTQQGSNADDPALKQVVNDLATEINSLSIKVTTLSALQNVDTSRLSQLAQRMNQLCGPAASFPAPGGSAAPAAPSHAS